MLVFLPSCSDDENSEEAEDASDEKGDEGGDDGDGAADADAGADAEAAAGSESGPGDGIVDPSSGIRPRAPGEIGVCRLSSPEASKKECMDFVGRDVTDLPAGDYVLLARLDVPDDKQAWPVELSTACRKMGSDKDRKVRGSTTEVSTGSADHGYRLWGLGFNVPGDAAWASDCTWTLSAPHPEGANEFTGSWSYTATAEE